MPTYVLPQVLVFQDFSVQPVVAANPLSAHIAGGHAFLVRQSDATERDLGDLGLYDNGIDTNYAWPERPAGAVVDQSYTKLFIENALLQYYTNASGSGETISRVTNYANRIKADNTVFASTTNFDRETVLQSRDVQAGDIIKVRGVPTGTGATGDVVTLWTYVKAVLAEELAAVVGTTAAATSNAATLTLDVDASQTTGTGIDITAGTGYDGTAAGHTTETYVIRVIESSVAGDFTTARLRVISGSGTDDVASVVPAAAGSATDIGTRGLTVTLALATVNPADGLIVGAEFTVTVQQAFTAPAITVTGTYSSRQDTTYIATVTKGGEFATNPEITITTSNGVDQSGPHIVTATNTNIAIGTANLSLKFNTAVGVTALNKGDRYYIPVTGISDGPKSILVLGHNLDSTYADTEDLGIELYIRKPLLEVSEARVNTSATLNYDHDETEFTVNANINAYDPSWTSDGIALPLDVYSSEELGYGRLYLEYRAWLPTLSYEINSISDVANINDISGSLTPDNPLKWGVYKALTNSNGTPVLYSAVANPNDVDSWTAMLELLTQRDDVYNLVPLTRDAAVLGLYQAHVNDNSSPTAGLWRVAWFNLAGVSEIPIISTGSVIPNHLEATTTDGNVALAVFEDDTQTSGTQYTICRVPANNVTFLESGVRAGDIVRALYTIDGLDNVTYSEFVVDEVQSETQLRVLVGPSAPQTVPSKIEIWRNLTATEEAQELALTAGAYNNRRIRATWPDLIESAGTIQEGYFLNCALAGLASGVLPQQGLTNIAIAGFSRVNRTTVKFSKAQLDIMALAGVWIVTQALDGAIYTRQALTTGDYEDINQREEMLTRNVDSISYRFKDYFSPYIGVTNVTPSMKAIIELGLTSLIALLKKERATIQLGGQLIDATVDQFYISSVFKDRYVVYLTLTVPYALNNLELHLVV